MINEVSRNKKELVDMLKIAVGSIEAVQKEIVEKMDAIKKELTEVKENLKALKIDYRAFDQSQITALQCRAKALKADYSMYHRRVLPVLVEADGDRILMDWNLLQKVSKLTKSFTFRYLKIVKNMLVIEYSKRGNTGRFELHGIEMSHPEFDLLTCIPTAVSE